MAQIGEREQQQMGFRFRKSIGFGPLRVNFSKTGVSLTAGVPGAHVNFDVSGRREHPVATIGLPGTGLSYRTATWFGIGAAVLLMVLAALLVT